MLQVRRIIQNRCSRSFASSTFVPNHEPATNDDIYQLQNYLKQLVRLVVLTGAGISTESGIPDYRSEGVGLYASSKTRPVQYKEFMSSSEIRKRYWARNFVGWRRFSGIKPNKCHIALSQWEREVFLTVVTQNVDRLHAKAGSKNVIELHGTAYEVKCTSCDNSIGRHDFQHVLTALNPSMRAESISIRPDGDVDLTQEHIKKFVIPPCNVCGGFLKPNIVFFGDNVPKARVDTVYDKVKESDALLVIGSSLEVYSGYRFAMAASEQKKPILILNIGPTRADKLATLKINARCGEVLPKLILQSSVLR